MSALSPGHGPLADVFVTGIGSATKNGAPSIPFPTVSQITWRQRWDHWQARWGYRRGDHRVTPGLYALGDPDRNSPVLVTANYSLSFDAVRAALSGHSCYLLVLDTKGVNVWCAAGKGTFGTDELVERVFSTGLHQIVDHRDLILPQLGATGVSAQLVRRRSGFRVIFGPVRAADIPAFLPQRKATPGMRRVTFTLVERLVLIPVEIVNTMLPMIVAGLVLYLLAGPVAALGVVAAVLTGTALFPLLLPWLPFHDFSANGYLLGSLVALASAWGTWRSGVPGDWGLHLRVAGLLLGLPPVTAYLAMNFTGSTPITSPSWVRREMRRYIPIMAVSVALGAIAIVIAAIRAWIGG